MRNKELLRKVSVKCVAAIMTAAMLMSPIAGPVTSTVTVYAADAGDTAASEGGQAADAGDAAGAPSEEEPTVEVTASNDPKSVAPPTLISEPVAVNETDNVNNCSQIGTNNGIVVKNYGPNDNDNPNRGRTGTIDTNANTVNTNGGSIGKGNVSTWQADHKFGNFGTVDTNTSEGVIYFNGKKIFELNSNGGTLNENLGTVVHNGNGGTINNNDNIVKENLSGGVINKNGTNGTVGWNSGLIKESEGYVGTNVGSLESNKNILETNKGTVNVNQKGGDIQDNAGATVKINHGRIGTSEDVDENGTHYVSTIETNASDGVIDKNTAKVGTNEGIIKINANLGIVGSMDDKGNLTGGNKGTVKTNEAGGIIFNVTGGFVQSNQGTVYNCGGTVGSSNTDKGAGTEYFLVDIVYENAYALDSSGLTHEYGRDWIRQDGGGNSTAYITITPTAGYEIKEISGIPGYVTAKSNSDGSWLLTIYSGASTSLNIAASQIQITVTPDQAPQGPAGVAEGGTTGEPQVQGNAYEKALTVAEIIVCANTDRPVFADTEEFTSGYLAYFQINGNTTISEEARIQATIWGLAHVYASKFTNATYDYKDNFIKAFIDQYNQYRQSNLNIINIFTKEIAENVFYSTRDSLKEEGVAPVPVPSPSDPAIAVNYANGQPAVVDGVAQPAAVDGAAQPAAVDGAAQTNDQAPAANGLFVQTFNPSPAVLPVTLGPASNPAVTTPAIDTSATALATATWDGASIKIGETTVTVSALAAQDCAGLASTAVTQAELTVVYESIFASTIAANGGSVADARAETLKIATSLAEYITKDLPTNYTPAEAATYKAAYMDAFLKAIASGKTFKKARNAALSAARTKMAQALLDQLNNAHTEGETIGIETPVAPAATQSPVVGEAADPAAAQMIAQAQQAMQDASALANGQ